MARCLFGGSLWVLVESSNLVVERFHWPEVIGQAVIILALFGLLLTVVLAWYHGDKDTRRLRVRNF